MRRTRIFLAASALALIVSGAALAGGGCLAGHYKYYSDEGALVGAATVGCANSWSWGVPTDNAVFVPTCYEDS